MPKPCYPTLFVWSVVSDVIMRSVCRIRRDYVVRLRLKRDELGYPALFVRSVESDVIMWSVSRLFIVEETLGARLFHCDALMRDSDI